MPPLISFVPELLLPNPRVAALVGMLASSCAARGAPGASVSTTSAPESLAPATSATASSAPAPAAPALVAPALLRITAGDIPTEGDSLEAFVPPGWTADPVVKGDLDGTAGLDAALVLEREPLPEGAPEPTTEDEDPDQAPRVLLVLLQSDRGRWRRAGLATELLGCRRCGGAFWGVMDMPVALGIANGELSVGQEWGSREVNELEIRLRYSIEDGRFKVVRAIEAWRDRAAGGETDRDVDYVTGTIVEVKRDPTGKATTRRQKLPATRVFLEDLKFGEMP